MMSQAEVSIKNVEAESSVSNIDLENTIKGFQNGALVEMLQKESDVQN